MSRLDDCNCVHCQIRSRIYQIVAPSIANAMEEVQDIAIEVDMGMKEAFETSLIAHISLAVNFFSNFFSFPVDGKQVVFALSRERVLEISTDMFELMKQEIRTEVSPIPETIQSSALDMTQPSRN